MTAEEKPKENQCPICGAPLPLTGEPCPICGYQPEAVIPEAEPAPVKKRTRSKTVVTVLLIVLGVAALLLASALYGAYSGLQQRQKVQETQSAVHYQRGYDAWQAGDYALAVAEFEYVQRLSPSYRDTGEMLAKAQQAMQSQPTPTSEAREEAANKLFARAQDEMEGQDWSKAIATLQELQTLAPGHNEQQVNALLYQCMYQAGLQAAGKGDVTAALEWFKQAMNLSPDNADVRRQIALADAYIKATSDWGRDWESVVKQLSSLYALSPDYADVKDRLATAYVRYGDELFSEQEWCQSEEQYQNSLKLRSASQITAKLDLAKDYCLATPTPPTVVPTGSVTPEASTTPQAVAGSGTIYLSLGTSGGTPAVYALPVGANAKPRLIIPNGDQPDIRSDGTLAYRNLASNLLGIGQAQLDGTFLARVTAYAEDSWPSWEPGDGRVVFSSTRESDRKWRIYIAEGWAQGQESKAIAYGKSPAWGPSGLIAYRGCDQSGNKCGIYLIRADGTQMAQITDNPEDDMPAWSPDGKKLAFASPRSGVWTIWVKDISSGKLTRLLDGSSHDSSPVWSPDGSQIAFISDRGGTWGVWVVSVDGGEPQMLYQIGTLPRNWDEMRLDWQ